MLVKGNLHKFALRVTMDSISIGNSGSQSFLEWTAQAKRRVRNISLDTPFFIFN